MDLYPKAIFSDKNRVKVEATIDECDNNMKYELTLDGLCRGCLCTDNLLDMLKTNYHLGQPENYLQMLTNCFSIQLNEFEDNVNLRHICMNCVGKLREAYEFKSQLENAQKKIKSLLESKDIIKDEENFDSNDSHNFNFDDAHYSSHIIEGVNDVIETQNFETIKKKPHRKKIKMKKKRKNKCNIDPLVDRTIKNSTNVADFFENPLKSSGHLIDEIKKTKNVRIKNVPANLPYKLEKTDLQCKICNEIFPLHKSLKMHISVHYPNHVCDICGRVFATELQVYNHAKSHKPATLTCSLCPDIRFKSTGSLQAHTKKTHLGDRNLYRCVDCNMRFCSYNSRRRHLVEVHGDDSRKYCCKNCPKRYGLKTHLDSHIRNVHLQVRNYVCDTCGDAFFTKIILKNHMAKHTGEKNFHCSLCDKKYARKHTLTEHMKIHNNVKSHVCAICGRAFTQKSTLKYHMRIHKESVLEIVKTYEIKN